MKLNAQISFFLNDLPDTTTFEMSSPVILAKTPM